ncbi:Protein of unknown function [Pyronema omphalodes CBS 100304]|uniref:Uncharacterized protein n=1 Tax=Pyronema omphalodes (strain CBS 100304) TaxID=1076935 RepID=U4L3P3_PYROM|nr:Protein of unknown function [Pyronema omphalodes CBS 100304]
MVTTFEIRVDWVEEDLCRL